MKRLLLALIFPFVLAVAAHGQSIEDQYIRIYSLIQEADGLNATSPAQARLRYTEAQAALQRFQRVYAEWNPQIVEFRLKYVAEKLAAEPGAGGSVPATATAGAKAATVASPEVSALEEQVRQLQADRVQLEGKLREALAAQPATADPRELARAQERIKSLQKENELLQVSLEQAKGRTPVVTPVPEKEEPAQLTAARQTIASLTQERDALQSQVTRQQTDAKTMELLRQENEVLKGRLAKAETPAATADPAALTKSRQETAALQAERDQLRLEKAALEARVVSLARISTQTMASASAPATTDSRSEGRIRQLERDKDKLERDLGQARQELAARNSRPAKGKPSVLETELIAARAKISVYEAKAVPFTAEELALFRGTPAALSTNTAPPAPARELPAGATALLAEARRHFAAREMDKAELKYQEVLRQDDRNVVTLANLAVIQLEMNRLDEAEKNARKALAENPNDDFSLLVLGQIQFRQKKYDDAVQTLSRAAQQAPEDPEVQNHLGLALSEKGMRVAAEAALRKAVQLRPGYGTAHHNLAVVYISAKPPSTELAKWHYQRSLAAGASRDPDLERLLGLRLEGKAE